MGDALVDGSRPLEQQETFGGRSKVQQVVQQRLLPHRPIMTRHTVWAQVDHFFHTLIEKTHLLVFNAGDCCHDTLLMFTSLKMDTSSNRDVHPQDWANVKQVKMQIGSLFYSHKLCGSWGDAGVTAPGSGVRTLSDKELAWIQRPQIIIIITLVTRCKGSLTWCS